MAIPTDKVGTTFAPTTATVDPARARAYAEATNDPNPAYAEGRLAPPVFGVVPVWDAVMAATAELIPADVLMFIVHGEQDMHFHQPLVPGTTLTTTATAHSVRVGGSGTRVVVRLDSGDEAGEAVLTQYMTSFVRGVSDGGSAGPDKPAHDLAPSALDAPVGEPYSVHVDDDQTFRYRDASGDRMPIHVDDEVARSVGLPGIIAHGLCTMAMCSQAVVARVADGDPARLKRLAVRFASNVRPGQDVVTQAYDLDPAEAFPGGGPGGVRAYGFVATAGGATVITNGRAEVADA